MIKVHCGRYLLSWQGLFLAKRGLIGVVCVFLKKHILLLEFHCVLNHSKDQGCWIRRATHDMCHGLPSGPWYDPPAENKLGWVVGLFRRRTVSHFQEKYDLNSYIQLRFTDHVGVKMSIFPSGIFRGPSLNLPMGRFFLAPRSFNWRKPVKDWRLIPWGRTMGAWIISSWTAVFFVEHGNLQPGAEIPSLLVFSSTLIQPLEVSSWWLKLEVCWIPTEMVKCHECRCLWDHIETQWRNMHKILSPQLIAWVSWFERDTLV